MKQFQGELPYFSAFKIKNALDILEDSQLIKVTDAEQNQVLMRRKVMSYSLTERGYELAHLEDGDWQ